MKIGLLFPNQLFADLSNFQADQLWFLEDPLLFGDAHYPERFHKKKLVIMRAAMKKFAQKRRDSGRFCQYFDYTDLKQSDFLFSALKKAGATQLVLFDPVDFILKKRLTQLAAKLAIGVSTSLRLPSVIWHENPLFLDSLASFKKRKGKGLRMQTFYKNQRKAHDLLIDANGEPVGGKWSFDAENRKALPDDLFIPPLAKVKPIPELAEAEVYVLKKFPENPGEIGGFYPPLTHDDAQAWLLDFCKNRLRLFGDYEDALDREDSFLFHSLLTPMLNMGLLDPKSVISAVLAENEKQPIPLNSLEGFIRQIIGWREFIRGTYELHGVEMRNANFFDHHRPLPKGWYEAETGVPPIDAVLRRVNRDGYAHHIERLMVLGGFLLLTETDPKLVYQWFMELFIDAWDWVMVPNVYGMSQFAPGGLMMTKPYLSGSAYLRKMGNYPKGAWCDLWDALYWHFIGKNADKLRTNPRMALACSQYQKMKPERREKLETLATNYLEGRSL